MTRARVRAHVDTSELRELAVDLSKAPGRLQRRAPKTMRWGARKVRRAMRKDAAGHRYLPHFPAAVGYDRMDAIGLHYQIGFELGDQGSLAHIIVFGSVNNAPVYNFADALWREAPRIVRRLAEDSENVVFGAKG